MIYRFVDKEFKTDYIIFINIDSISIDLSVFGFNSVMNTEINFCIINGKINWNVDGQGFISEECKLYCDKIIKLKAFT